MMRSSVVRCLMMSLLALVSGCTEAHDVLGEPRDAADAGAEPAAESGVLCQRVAAVQCEGEQRCCSTPPRSRERCESELAQACAQSLYLDRIAERAETGFDASAAERIFSEFAQRTARCDPSVLRWVSSAQGLRGIFRGTRGAGESCDPAGGLTSDPAELAVALTTCRVDDGLACVASGLLGGWTCAAKQATGGACLTDDNCQPADVCDNYSQPMAGNCVERLPLEAECELAAECDSLQCSDGWCSEALPEAVYCTAQ